MVKDPLFYRRKSGEVVRRIEEWLSTLKWQGATGSAGHGLIRLFARLTEVIADRLNQAPEQHFRAFLAEAGIDQLAPRAARAELTFTPVEDGLPVIQVRQGTQVATRPAGGQPEVIFETERMLNAIPSRLGRCIALDRLAYSDRTAEARGEQAGVFAAFQGETERQRILYIGHHTLFVFPDAASRENARVVVGFTFAAAGDPVEDGGWSIQWLYFDGVTWANLQDAGAEIDDQTRDFSRDGEVKFYNLPVLAASEVNGISSTWLAARMTGGSDRRKLPVIDNIEIYQEIMIPQPETKTAVARIPFPGGVSAAGDEVRHEQHYYIGHENLFIFPNPIHRRRAIFTFHFIFEKPGMMPVGEDTQLQWLYWDGSQWAELQSSGAVVEDQTERWSKDGLVKFTMLPELVATEVNAINGPWLAVKFISSRPFLPILRDVVIHREIPAEEAVIDGALATIQAGTAFVPLDQVAPFMPFGPHPVQLDAFYLRIDEAFTKPGATVTLAFTLEGLPPDLEDTGELEKLKIEWEYYSSDGWTRLGACVRGCPTLERYNFDAVPEFSKPRVTTIPFSRRKVLEFAVPSGMDLQHLPAPFQTGKKITDIYTGAHFVQFPVPAECAGLPDEILVNGCYTAERLKFRDKTCAFTAQGEVVIQFTVPIADSADPVFAHTTVNGQTGYWLRARIAEGAYAVPAESRRGLLAGGLIGEAPFQPPTPYPPVVRHLRATYSNYYKRSAPKQPEHCQSKTDKRWRQHSAVLHKRLPFQPYAAVRQDCEQADESVSYEEPALYLGFNPLLPESTQSAFPPGYWIQLRIDLIEDDRRERNRIHWEYWNGKQWRLLRVIDETRGLARPEYLGFIAPADHAASSEFGHLGYWLRSRPDKTGIETAQVGDKATVSAHDGPNKVAIPMPLLKSIRLNTVPAVNAETIENELLGSSSGERNQRFVLARPPVLADVEIEVLEPDQRTTNGPEAPLSPPGIVAATEDHAGWVLWTPVTTLHGCGPDSRCYTIDRHSGEIRFGDGRCGRIPPPGVNNIRARRYRTHSGIGGNLAIGAITELRSPSGALNDIQSVSNLEASTGGSAVETISRAKARGPQTLKHRQRAVTREDYQWLALEIDGVERAYCLPARDANGLLQPGWVTVVIVPNSAGALADNADKKPVPSPALLRSVRTHLEKHALANLGKFIAPDSQQRVIDEDQIYVKGPDYIEVKVRAVAVTANQEKADEIKFEILKRLDDFLHPLHGGPHRDGWQAGRDVYLSEIAAEIEQTPGVDHVAQASLQPVNLHQQCLSTAEGTQLKWAMPAGSQVSTLDEQIKLVLVNPLAAGVISEQIVVHSFKKSDDVAIVAADNAALANHLQISQLSKDDFTVTFHKAVDELATFPQPAMALYSDDKRLRLPIIACHFAYGAQKQPLFTGVTLCAVRSGDMLSLVHPVYRRRRNDLLPIVKVVPCEELQSIFVPEGHLVFSGDHEIEVISQTEARLLFT